MRGVWCGMVDSWFYHKEKQHQGEVSLHLCVVYTKGKDGYRLTSKMWASPISTVCGSLLKSDSHICGFIAEVCNWACIMGLGVYNFYDGCSNWTPGISLCRTVLSYAYAKMVFFRFLFSTSTPLFFDFLLHREKT